LAIEYWLEIQAGAAGGNPVGLGQLRTSCSEQLGESYSLRETCENLTKHDEAQKTPGCVLY